MNRKQLAESIINSMYKPSLVEKQLVQLVVLRTLKQLGELPARNTINLIWKQHVSPQVEEEPEETA